MATKLTASLQVETVTLGLRLAIQHASEAFIESPSASNWTRLEHAMHAWQQYNGPEKTMHAEHLYVKVGIGQWVEHLHGVQMREMKALKGALSATITVGRKA